MNSWHSFFQWEKVLALTIQHSAIELNKFDTQKHTLIAENILMLENECQ